MRQLFASNFWVRLVSCVLSILSVLCVFVSVIATLVNPNSGWIDVFSITATVLSIILSFVSIAFSIYSASSTDVILDLIKKEIVKLEKANNRIAGQHELFVDHIVATGSGDGLESLEEYEQKLENQ